VLQFGVAVVERDASIESLVEIDFSASEAEAAALGRNLEAAAVPLYDVVVADHARMDEAADAVQIRRSGTPGGYGGAGTAGEAAIVVGDKTEQDRVGRVQIGSLRQTELTDQAILQHTPEAFDTAFGLGRAGGDEGDAELIEGATELSGIALALELFGEGPGVVVALEDAAAITVESQRRTVAAQQLAEQNEIAEGGFGGKELSSEDFAGGVVSQAESGKQRTATLEPIVRRAVELHSSPSRAERKRR
jgi:hypothetical protein